MDNDIWRGLEEVQLAMAAHVDNVHDVILLIADYLAPLLEAYAVENASWTDRTGNARQGLQGFVEDVSRTIVDIYISHRVDYGVYLETLHAGRYAILWPTIQANLPVVNRMLRQAIG